MKRKEIGEQDETLVRLVQSLFERQWRRSSTAWLMNPSHGLHIAILARRL